MNPAPKDIKETKLFAKKRKEFISNTKLFDDLTEGLLFVIARKPDSFPLISDTDIRVARFRSVSPTTPPFIIFYRELDICIELIDLIEDRFNN